MSWRDAQTVARELYTQLRAKYPIAFIRMIIRALERLLNAEDKSDSTKII
jgi:hypothetical protein